MRRTGQNIGRYHIVEQLGQGGMATVYKAYDTRLERDVAIKVIRTGAITPDMLPELLKRFEREAKSLAKMKHRDIVNIHDYGEFEGAPYLVMEYLPGGTLKARTGHTIPYQDAARLLLPIARALDYAHKRGVLHRDIKPANILITEEGEPLLSDFGIAKMLESGQETQLTGTGVGIGTPEYMAPEQWTGKAVPQTDLYALGIVFFELITGIKPFTADTPAAILLKQVNDPLPQPSLFVPDLPDEVGDVLLKTLAKKPADRYESMAGFMVALEGLAGSGENIAFESTLSGLETNLTQTLPISEASTDRREKKRKVFLQPKERKKTRRLWIGSVVGLFLVCAVITSGIIAVGKSRTGQRIVSVFNSTSSNNGIAILTETKTYKPSITETVSPTPTKNPTQIPTKNPTQTLVVKTPDASPTAPLSSYSRTEDRYAWNYLETQISGGVELEIYRLLLANKNAVDMVFPSKFDDVDVVGEIIFRVTNTTDGKITIYPSIATIVVGREQISLGGWGQTSVGDYITGEVYPGVTLIGGGWFGIKETKLEKIDRIIVGVYGPEGDGYTTIGDDYYFDISLPESGFEESPGDYK